MTDDLVKRLLDVASPLADEAAGTIHRLTAELAEEKRMRQEEKAKILRQREQLDSIQKANRNNLPMTRGLQRRVAELEAGRDRAIDDARDNAEDVDLVSQYRAERDAAKADNARLREALAFYANEENYKGYNAIDFCGCCSSWYEPRIHINGEDSGHIARAALTGKKTK
jgi:hypothetical protein